MSALPGPRPRPGAWVGYALVAAAAASWGAQSVVAKLLLTGGLEAGTLISTRTALAATIMIAALAAINPRLLRVERPDLGRLVVLGVVGMAFSTYTYYFALQRIPVAIAALLIYTASGLSSWAAASSWPASACSTCADAPGRGPGRARPAHRPKRARAFS